MYGLGACQTDAFVLDLRRSEFVRLLTSGVSVYYSPSAFLELSPTDFQNQMLWGLIFLLLVSRTGVPFVGLEIVSPQRGPPYLCYPSNLWSLH